MKITETSLIQNSEKELIDAITGDLNWDVIERLFKEKYNLSLQDDVEYKRGDMVVYKNQIAYKLDFEVKVTMSVLFDRKGECLEVVAVDRDEMGQEPQEQAPETQTGIAHLNEKDPGFSETANEQVSQMASRIADMITDINKE